MQRTALWIVGAGVGSVALVLALRAQEQYPNTSPSGTPGKTVFTFSDEAQMREFAQLWNQREAVLIRMATLQQYWNQEQGDLARLNAQLASQYRIDVNKSYSLDPERKVLTEREVASEPQVPPDAAPPSSPSIVPATP